MASTDNGNKENIISLNNIIEEYNRDTDPINISESRSIKENICLLDNDIIDEYNIKRINMVDIHKEVQNMYKSSTEIINLKEFYLKHINKSYLKSLIKTNLAVNKPYMYILSTSDIETSVSYHDQFKLLNCHLDELGNKNIIEYLSSILPEKSRFEIRLVGKNRLSIYLEIYENKPTVFIFLDMFCAYICCEPMFYV